MGGHGVWRAIGLRKLAAQQVLRPAGLLYPTMYRIRDRTLLRLGLTRTSKLHFETCCVHYVAKLRSMLLLENSVSGVRRRLHVVDIEVTAGIAGANSNT